MISDNLLNELVAFRHERDWEQFHTTRNLASALCVEAAELLDIFRWARDVRGCDSK
jgi:NTP pyrophosphatase (non-canonical NTP hydrolase)